MLQISLALQLRLAQQPRCNESNNSFHGIVCHREGKHAAWRQHHPATMHHEDNCNIEQARLRWCDSCELCSGGVGAFVVNRCWFGSDGLFGSIQDLFHPELFSTAIYFALCALIWGRNTARSPGVMRSFWQTVRAYLGSLLCDLAKYSILLERAHLFWNFFYFQLLHALPGVQQLYASRIPCWG